MGLARERAFRHPSRPVVLGLVIPILPALGPGSGPSGGLDPHRLTVAERLSGLPHNIRGVVALPNDGVGPELFGVLQHALVGLVPGLLAHLAVGGPDVAPDEGPAAFPGAPGTSRTSARRSRA